MNAFETLNAVNVNGHTEQRTSGKTSLTYLSWCWAWAEVKKRYPDATYEVVKLENGLPYCYDPHTGYMVYTRVKIDGVEHEMWLPVMDGANKAMKAEPYKYRVKNPNHKYAKLDNDGIWRDRYGNEQPEYLEKEVAAATMFDVNKAIMRCLTKNLAMFGLGLYIYAGEDLPEVITPEPQSVAKPEKPEDLVFCAECGCEITDVHRGKTTWTRDQIVEQAFKKFNRPVCYDCAVKLKTSND